MKDINLLSNVIPFASFYKFAFLGLIFMLSLSGGAFADIAAENERGADKNSASPVKGKKICLDPGHGGSESGAVGIRGLEEKDVNLREALILKDMLEKAGAKVILTRYEDINVSLSDRWKLNKEHKTDLFVSMHHNANAQADRSINRIESFYHYKDEGGPSEDAARSVHREIQAALKLPGKVYMCWAYGALRENAYPAILIEPSYIANSDEEDRLRNDEYLKTICAAYFRGIENFFAGGRPEIRIPDKIAPSPDGRVTAEILSPAETALVDPQTISIRIDAKPIDDYSYDPRSGKLDFTLPPQTDKGTRHLAISARNIAGRASFVAKRDIPITPAEGVLRFERKSQLFGGALNGKKIVVDPEGGGDDPVAIGDKGLRASDVNLTTALFLYDYLKRAGADVSITRARDQSMDNVARVRFGLDKNPDVFLSVGHRLPEPGMGEKPGMNVSRAGARWEGGRKISRKLVFHLRQILGTGAELGDVSNRDPLPTEDHNWSSWEVMHAAQGYTAVYVCPLMFDAPNAEERLSRTSVCRKSALAILYGLLDYFDLNDADMASIEGIVIDHATGKPLQDALVFLNGDLITQTEPDGKFLFKYLSPGKRQIEAMRGGYRTYSQILDIPEKKMLRLKIEMVP